MHKAALLRKIRVYSQLKTLDIVWGTHIGGISNTVSLWHYNKVHDNMAARNKDNNIRYL